ncbi:hypothetical protein CXB51_034911 [Gossypium anomalum]|uniref:Reverse transcriptase Ty1/copia-type domain-containing protein n=1 Tax=Gossypium anomalum TaxID=47600 RepID=A0A8J6CJB6_9ROSI|nr:hypothetical protein CXB51_034911 [Gossypium anomalum]
MDLRVGHGARVAALAAEGGFHYFITFTDDFSRYGYVYLMSHKSEDLEKFKELKNEVQNQLGKTIKTLRSNRGREYLSLEFDNLLKKCGIVAQLTPPAAFTLNRIPSKSVQKTPYEMWTGKHPNKPRTYQEVVTSPDSKKWLEAMTSEMDSMYENQVWTLIDPPEGVKPIRCKWVFKKKTDMDAMFKSIRILLAIAAFHDYEIWQMDVKIAFLNGKLEEDVYMTQPEDFGFIKNENEPCVYKKVSGSTITFLVLYVDDILIMGNDIPTLQSIKTWLGSCFSVKDLGEATYILGFKIYRDRSRRLLGLSQSTYIDKVLKRFNMEESKRGFLPMRHGISLSKEMCPSTPQEREYMSKIPYASAIRSIMYAMLCTHPDVSYALSMTSRYQVDPGEGHWTTVKNILKYLRRTKDMFLIYGGEEELSVKGYTDASFQTDKDDSRSQSSFVFCLNSGAVIWKSSKQSTVVDSTIEAEYIAASEAAKEVVWIKKFIT